MLPALSDYTRLLDTFLAGRNPRTLAAYQADLEDYRRFMEASLWISRPPLMPSGGCSAARMVGRARSFASTGRR